MKRIVISITLIFFVLFTGCKQNPSSTINPKVVVTATPPANPQSGMASMYGQVMHKTGVPMVDTIVRLAQVARGENGQGGAYILDMARSPATRTDADGNFAIENIKAGEYVIVVGDVEGSGIYEIIPNADGKAKVWNFPADVATNIGVLTVTISITVPVSTPPASAYPNPTGYPSP